MLLGLNNIINCLAQYNHFSSIAYFVLTRTDRVLMYKQLQHFNNTHTFNVVCVYVQHSILKNIKIRLIKNLVMKIFYIIM